MTLASRQQIKLSDLPDVLAGADRERLGFRTDEKGILTDDWQRQRVLLAADADVIW